MERQRGLVGYIKVSTKDKKNQMVDGRDQDAIIDRYEGRVMLGGPRLLDWKWSYIR